MYLYMHISVHLYTCHQYTTQPPPPVLQPLLRDAYEKNPTMDKSDAQELLERCLRVLFYRDCRALNKVGWSEL